LIIARARSTTRQPTNRAAPELSADRLPRFYTALAIMAEMLGKRTGWLGGAAASFRLSPVSLIIAIRARVCSRSPLCIAHTPGHMILTGFRNAALAVL
jgi:hypothetical protein